jgi:hypothetical protein
MKGALALMLAALASPVQATWISICRGDVMPVMARVLAEAIRPAGDRRVLVASDDRVPGCEGSELPLEGKQIRAGEFASPRLVADSDQGLVLRGSEAKNGFLVSEVYPVASAISGPVTAVAGVELLPSLDATAFGVDQRATVRRDRGSLILECAAGALPAGAVLRMSSRGVPRGAPVTVALRYAATDTFQLGVTDRARAAQGDPLMFATLASATAPHALVVLPAAGLDLATVDAWTLACPSHAARLDVRSVRLETQTSSPPPGRALWAWQPSAWLEQPSALLDKLVAVRADTVFVTVQVDMTEAHVLNAPALQSFIAAAAGRGVRVWAVAGDPQAVLPAGRAAFVARAAAFARYNRDAPAASRLAGVQYDIEPYLNPGYNLDPVAWHQAYLETIRALRREGGDLKLDVAVPFWWAGEHLADGSLLDALATTADSVTVMNYRTDSTAVKRSAQPFLEWGVRARRAVRIALEVGPISDNESRTYLPAPRGEVVLFAVGGANLLLLFDAPVTLAGARAFRLSHTMRVPGSVTSFQENRQQLLTLVADLERQWGAWPVFAGIALHEY